MNGTLTENSSIVVGNNVGAEGDMGKLPQEMNSIEGAKYFGNNIRDVKVYKYFHDNISALEAALIYAERGFYVLPINYILPDGFCSCKGTGIKHNEGEEICGDSHPGKHPVSYLAFKGVNSATTDPKKIKNWWSIIPNANIGIAAGKSGLVVLDIDGEKGKQSLLSLDKNNEIISPDGTINLDTPTARSGRTEFGKHIFFKKPEDVIISNRVSFAEGLDFRSDGGYIIVAPSNHLSGNKYTWEKSIFEFEFAEMPQWLKDAAGNKKVQDHIQNQFESESKIPEGKRNDILFRFAGFLRNRGLEYQEIYDSLKSINDNRCDPPLDDNELSSIAESITKYPKSHRFSEIERPSKVTPIDAINETIEYLLNKDKDARLVYTSLEDPYLWLKPSDHFEMIKLSEKSRPFKKFLFNQVKERYGIDLRNDETFKNAILAIECTAEKITIDKGISTHPFELGYGCTWYDNSAWIDLCRADWKGIKISKEGFVIVDLPAIFLRTGTQRKQVEPNYNASPDDFDKIFKYINVKHASNKLLIKAWICSAMMPRFKNKAIAQPILQLTGPTSAGKTKAAQYAKKIVDPVKADNNGSDKGSLPKEPKDLAVVLHNSIVAIFDNVGRKISDEISDLLCIASTRGSYKSRKLYSDDEEIPLNLSSAIIITSINIDKLNEDLINRMIPIELRGFDEKNRRKAEVKLDEDFEKDLPDILGGAYISISRALCKIDQVYEAVSNLEDAPRLMDFCVIGEALSSVWGEEEGSFIKAFNEAQGKKSSENVKSSPAMDTLIKYIKNLSRGAIYDKKSEGLIDYIPYTFYGPIKSLHRHLKEYYHKENGQYPDNKTWPQSDKGLGNKIKESTMGLKNSGIEINVDDFQTGGNHYYTIKAIDMIPEKGEDQKSVEHQTAIDEYQSPDEEDGW